MLFWLRKHVWLKNSTKKFKNSIVHDHNKISSIYGSETWTLRKDEETRFVVFERKMLRIIYRSCIDSDTEEWRIRHNEELSIEEFVSKPVSYYR